MDNQTLTTFTPPPVQHMQVQTGVAGGDYSQGSWTLDEGNGEHFVTMHINFAQAFSKAPIISIGNVLLDASNERHIRINAGVENITANGFDLRIGTWADSVIYAAQFSWLAIAV